MATSSKKLYKSVSNITREQRETIDRAHSQGKFLTEKELRETITAIRNTIKNEEIRLRSEYKWLDQQNVLGLGCFLISFFALLTVAYLYVKRVLHWGLAIPLIALPGSILHEIEHDLIHNLYFKGKQWVQHMMFFVIWWVKMTIPPWYRKWMHLRHHIVSGTKEDIEERLIGLGLPMRLIRLLVSFNPMASSLILDDLAVDNGSDFNKYKVVLISSPTVIPFSVLTHLFFSFLRVFYGFTFTEYDPALFLPLWLWPYVRDICVIMILPNILRQTCLNLVASYSHYYGDIPAKHVYYQNQILDHWILWPMQLLCFNFGATHVIHHYIPNQPFYLRQMLAPKVLEQMIAHGVRRNDFGIVSRNNRFYEFDEEKEEQQHVPVLVPQHVTVEAH